MREFVVKIDMEEIPKSCDDCDINIKYQRFGIEIWCPFLGWYADPDKCPILCQLPEGHGRLIDADEFLKRAIGTKCFRGDYLLMLQELVGESTTIVPADTAERSET